MGAKAFGERWARWLKCSLCEQQYHGIVLRALSWACWKTTWDGRRWTCLGAWRCLWLEPWDASQAKQCEEENAAAAATRKKLPADLEQRRCGRLPKAGAAEAARQAMKSPPVFPRAQDGHHST